jgi:formimidoylglutamate deiminase
MRLFAADALLPQGWARDVLLEIDAAGHFVAVASGAACGDAERAAGPVVPGMPNVHSHAFQRALAGRTGRAQPGGDSFWTWREAMYAFLDRVDADAFEAIAGQAYVEMLKAGYTGVAEFHYVHHDPRGAPYADPAELALRVVAAARSAGIALTLLPVFYAHSGFGGRPPMAAQRRFVQTPESFARLVSRLTDVCDANGERVGVAPHSLRAVTPEELAVVATLVPAGPIHMHVAEQLREVVDCIAWSGQRPVEWLLAQQRIDRRWCIVHATHLVAGETSRLAASGAVAGIAATTEADLGDGTFAARAWLDARGSFGVGSDANTVIDPFAELRQLEWSQRLASLSRNVLVADGATIGDSLYVAAATGGAQALMQPAGRIAPGLRADVVVLDGDDPALAEQSPETLLDAAIFGPCRRPVRDVMVGGHWVVRDGHHARETEALARFRVALRRCFAE